MCPAVTFRDVRVFSSLRLRREAGSMEPARDDAQPGGSTQQGEPFADEKTRVDGNREGVAPRRRAVAPRHAQIARQAAQIKLRARC